MASSEPSASLSARSTSAQKSSADVPKIAEVPVAVQLNLSPSALPAFVCSHYVHRLISREQLTKQAEKAWESFGKPGRDPAGLSSAVQAFAQQQGWGTPLRLAHMSEHWEHVVGSTIAANTSVGELRDGVLTIRAKTPVWATQLLYLLPTITQRVRKWLAPTKVVRIEIRGGQAKNRGYRQSNHHNNRQNNQYGRYSQFGQGTYQPGVWG
jgi:predicted nucleic acid-binding Zn ribbon protein